MEWNPELLSLLSIPFISAIVGWVTNYLAVKMMFYPIEFKGIRPFFGWQGLIPAKRREMAEIEVELVLGKLLSVEELAQRLDGEQLACAIERRLKQVLKSVVNEVMEASAPDLWAAVPVQGKNLVYRRIENDMPRVVKKLVTDFQLNINEILNIKELVVEQLVGSPSLINEIFLTAGAKEFPFIVRSGFYFGFLFGLPTMFLWHFFFLTFFIHRNEAHTESLREITHNIDEVLSEPAVNTFLFRHLFNQHITLRQHRAVIAGFGGQDDGGIDLRDF